MIVLIPSLEPTARLAELIRGLRREAPGIGILVVDDGSGSGWDAAFSDAADAGAEILRLPSNAGKGAALKAGFARIAAAHPGEAVVTADSDGQHTVADILAVGRTLEQDDGALVLGVRSFTGGGRSRPPWRSRFGNAASRALFRLAAGVAVSDTQTGLRGVPASLLPRLLAIPGERFEYEQRVLLQCARDGVPIREVAIETVYLEGNSGSHFRPLVDSVRVLLPVAAFAASSFLGFLVDAAVLFALYAITGWLIPSIVAARLVSASVNFAVNRRYVFRGPRSGRVRQALRYALLAGVLLASNIVWMQALTSFGVPIVIAKVVTESVLFITSYRSQRSFVFAQPGQNAIAPLTAVPARTA